MSAVYEKRMAIRITRTQHVITVCPGLSASSVQAAFQYLPSDAKLVDTEWDDEDATVFKHVFESETELLSVPVKTERERTNANTLPDS